MSQPQAELTHDKPPGLYPANIHQRCNQMLKLDSRTLLGGRLKCIFQVVMQLNNFISQCAKLLQPVSGFQGA
jgi:hypothetical protein